MSGRHWTEDELIARLYGTGQESADTAHPLETCGECRAKWEQAAARMAEARGEVGVTEEFLREQRARVQARLRRDRGLGAWWRPAAALAAMVVLGVGIAVRRAEPVKTAAETAVVSDAQLFDEIASVVNEQEPRVASSMRGLFSEVQTQ